MNHLLGTRYHRSSEVTMNELSVVRPAARTAHDHEGTEPRFGGSITNAEMPVIATFMFPFGAPQREERAATTKPRRHRGDTSGSRLFAHTSTKPCRRVPKVSPHRPPGARSSRPVPHWPPFPARSGHPVGVTPLAARQPTACPRRAPPAPSLLAPAVRHQHEFEYNGEARNRMPTTPTPRARRRISQAAAIILAAIIGAITTIIVSRRQAERRDDDIAEIRRTIQVQAARIDTLNAAERQKDATIDDLRRQLDAARQRATSTAPTVPNTSPPANTPSVKRIELVCGDGYAALPDHSYYQLVVPTGDCWTEWQKPPKPNMWADADVDRDVDSEYIVTSGFGLHATRTHYSPLARTPFVISPAVRFRNSGSQPVTIHIYAHY